MTVLINEKARQKPNKIIVGKIKNYLTNDGLIDQNELFSLMQYSKKSGIKMNQLDTLIGKIKSKLGFSHEQYVTEEIYREAVYKLSNSQKLDSAFEFYLKERAEDIGLNSKSANKLIDKIKTDFGKKKKATKKRSKLPIILLTIFVFCTAAGVFWYFNPLAKKTVIVANESFTKQSDQNSTLSNTTIEQSLGQPSAVVEYTYLYNRESRKLNIESLVNDLVYIDDPNKSRYITFFYLLKEMVNHLLNSKTPTDRYLERIGKNTSEAALSQSKFKKITVEYIKEEKILALINRIINAESNIPDVDVYSGQYLNRAIGIDWSDPDRSLLMLEEIFRDIANDLQSGKIPKSKESASEILEIARFASIVPISYYYNSMFTFVGENSFTKYTPSQVLLQTLPTRYSSNLIQNKISPLIKYEGFPDQILQMMSQDRDVVKDFKKWCDAVRDYEIIGSMCFLQSFAIKSDSWLTMLDVDNYFSNTKPSILVTDYKPLVERYLKLETLLTHAEKLLQMISTSDKELDFVRLSLEPIKIMHTHLLLLSRVVFFDIPLASDSLQTLMRIKRAQSFLNDDEHAMIEAGQLYASLTPILLKFHVSPSVHEMWQAIMKTLKDELSKNEYGELKQRSQTQPAWLEQPKLEL